MEPGRELDTLVAEKVMGLQIEWSEDTPCPRCGSEMRYCGSRSRCSECGEWVYSPYREYSTDIAAAMEAAVHMTMVHGYAFRLDIDYGHSMIEISFWSPREGMHDKPFKASGPIPGAICAAAVRAMSAETEDSL